MLRRFVFYLVFVVKRKVLRQVHCLVLCTCSCFTAFCQISSQDSAFSIQPVVEQYRKEIGASARIYSGAEYEGSYQQVLGNPFWNDKDFQNGQILYDGTLYTEVALLYDLVRNEVVIKSFQQPLIRLENARIDYFAISGHQFIHIQNDTSLNRLPDGFYDLLIESPELRLYAARSKFVKAPLHAEEKDSLVERNTYYVHYRNANYPLTHSSDLLRLFGNQKAEIRIFWKTHHLSFKKAPETTIIRTVLFWLQEKK